MALERLPRTVQALEAGIRERLHLGAQIHVSLHGEDVAGGAVGEDRPGVPLTADHLMLWLSSTKPVAAVALAQLWERGKLEIDDPIARHIPEFAANGKETITLRHLLTHTAGIRMLDVGWPGDPWEKILERICAMKPEPRWVPGEKAGYNHASSWFVLGEVVRRVDGRTFDRYVREEIFEPLGMAGSWVGMPRDRYLAWKEADRIGAMWNTETGGEPEPHGWDTEERCTSIHPGGNGYGPTRDLARFYGMILDRGAGILSPQSVEALTARHRVGMLDVTFKHTMDWSLGFIPNSAHYGADTVPYAYGHHASRRAVGHSGYRSSVAFADPEHGLATALVLNGTPSNAGHERRVRMILDALYEDLGLAAA
ncbi:MAG: serine hydrolase domain-containing protein [Acidobacteriota bacterium]